jgi:hypothetical protein
MNKITTWIFHLSWAHMLKKVLGLKYKSKMETEATISRCVLEIKNEVSVPWSKIKQIPYRLDIKAVQNFCVRWERNEHETPLLRPDPVFTTEEIAKMKLRFLYFVIIILLFPIGESFLFYLTSPLFVPGAGEGVKIGVSIFLALLILFGCGFGFDMHFKYRDALELHEKKRLSEHQLRTYRHWLILGYVVFLFSLLTVIFAGLSRIHFLEYIPVSDLPQERTAGIRSATEFGSLVTFCVTIVTGLLLAAVKQKQGKDNVRLLVYRSWHRANVRRNRLALELIRNATEIVSIVELCIEKNWQLQIDLKRIFLMETEYDPLFEAQYKTYMIEKAKPEFVLTENIYLRMMEVQGVYRDTFEYAILRDPAIREKLEFAKTIEKLPKAAIAAYILSISSEAGKTPFNTHALQNGKADPNLIHNLKNNLV